MFDIIHMQNGWKKQRKNDYFSILCKQGKIFSSLLKFLIAVNRPKWSMEFSAGTSLQNFRFLLNRLQYSLF